MAQPPVAPSTDPSDLSGLPSSPARTASTGDGASTSYADAGVNIEAADTAIELMKVWVDKARRPEMIGGLGGFAGLFDASALTRYTRPLLATSTDGVGTKVAIAQAMDVHDTIGFDLVGMVVDDLVVSRKITGPMLDAGCHAGYLATWWARHSGLEVVGSDLSRPALELGRRRSVELGRSVELVEAEGATSGVGCESDACAFLRSACSP